MNNFYRIACNCPSKKKRGGKVASNWLGSIDLDTPTVVYHHCKVCNTTYMHKVDSEGNVYRTVVTGKIDHRENVCVIEVE